MPTAPTAATTAIVLRQFAARLLLPLAVAYGLMVGLGVLVTKALDRFWPLSAEDSVNRELLRERDQAGDVVSLFFSTVGSTPAIVAVTALVAIVLVWRGRRWRAALFLAGAVTAQALIFLFTTLAIDRERPDVPHMDVSPPTSSFPSGHTSAAFALYCGLALILAVQFGRGPTRASWWWLLVAVPVAVALSRLYRGMHHPSDVVGSFVNGAICVLVLARGVLDGSVRWGRERGGGRRSRTARRVTIRGRLSSTESSRLSSSALRGRRG